MRIEERYERAGPEEVAELIRRELRPHFDNLTGFSSTAELRASPVYRQLEDRFRLALETLHHGRFSQGGPPGTRHRVLAWNVERGKELAGQLEAFRANPYLQSCGLMLLTETDVGMARSGNADVARTIAAELGFDYVFAPCYLSLVKGSGIERHVEGDNELGLHGNAILSRYPMREVRRVALRNGIDKMASNEKRLGSQTSIAATVDFPSGPLTVACVHLDANSTQRHRMEQMGDILDALPTGPALIGGDWNTTTFNSSTAFHAIMGYWLRVFMGPKRVIRNHFLHPYRWFERGLFQLLETRGFDFRSCNRIGDHSIFYDVDHLAQHKALAEWVPLWCFAFIRWALRDVGGGCPLMIDWFAARQVRCENPLVLHDVNKGPRGPLSDHDPIGVEIVLE